MWCPTSLEVNGKETEYPLPEPHLPLNFLNSTGMRYEAEEVRQCLLKGTGGAEGGVVHKLSTRWRQKHWWWCPHNNVIKKRY